jgi:cell division protein FtsN
MARRNRNSRNKDPAPGWVWMLFGLALGLVVAAGVYFRSTPPAPRATATSPAPAASPAAAPAQAAKDRRQTRGAEATRAAGAGAEPSESRFDFYEILPQFEVVVPEVESATRPVARSQPVEEPGSYVLQAGSFSALGDADRLKARIALLGIESRIQRVEIDDDVFHRVRIGPISDLEQLNRTRRQLRDAHVDTLLMKLP